MMKDLSQPIIDTLVFLDKTCLIQYLLLQFGVSSVIQGDIWGKGNTKSSQPFLRAITTVHTHFQAPVSPSNLRVLECPKCGTSRSVYCFLGR